VVGGTADRHRSLDTSRGLAHQLAQDKPRNISASKVPCTTARMNFLPSAVAIVFINSMSNQYKIHHRLPTGLHKRSASTGCHTWRVSRALRADRAVWVCPPTASSLRSATWHATLSSQSPNSRRIRPKICVFLLKGPKTGSNPR
jgi:hypothetical protein